MVTSARPFRSTRLKIQRANGHMDELQTAITELSSPGFYGIDVHSQDDGINVAVMSPRQLVPDSLPLIIGDAIHNLKRPQCPLLPDFAALVPRQTRLNHATAAISERNHGNIPISDTDSAGCGSAQADTQDHHVAARNAELGLSDSGYRAPAKRDPHTVVHAECPGCNRHDCPADPDTADPGTVDLVVADNKVAVAGSEW